MMIEVFTVFDSKASVYSRPWFYRTKGEALRTFTTLANSQDTDLGNHPEDFTLFHIGCFDDQRGCFVPLNTPVSLGVAIEYKKPDRQLQIPGTEVPK